MGGVTVHVEKPLPNGGALPSAATGRDPAVRLPQARQAPPGRREGPLVRPHPPRRRRLPPHGPAEVPDEGHRRAGQPAEGRHPLREAGQRGDKSTISTNIPSALLPALVKLSGTVKHGADISSLPYNPDKMPGFHATTGRRGHVLVMRRAAPRPSPTAWLRTTAARGPTPSVKRHKRKSTTTGTSGKPAFQRRRRIGLAEEHLGKSPPSVPGATRPGGAECLTRTGAPRSGRHNVLMTRSSAPPRAGGDRRRGRLAVVLFALPLAVACNGCTATRRSCRSNATRPGSRPPCPTTSPSIRSRCRC